MHSPEGAGRPCISRFSPTEIFRAWFRLLGLLGAVRLSVRMHRAHALRPVPVACPRQPRTPTPNLYLGRELDHVRQSTPPLVRLRREHLHGKLPKNASQDR